MPLAVTTRPREASPNPHPTRQIHTNAISNRKFGQLREVFTIGIVRKNVPQTKCPSQDLIEHVALNRPVTRNHQSKCERMCPEDVDQSVQQTSIRLISLTKQVRPRHPLSFLTRL